MAEHTENEMETLEGYLASLDELGNTVTSNWATKSFGDMNSGVSDVHKALHDLLQDSLALSIMADKK